MGKKVYFALSSIIVVLVVVLVVLFVTKNKGSTSTGSEDESLPEADSTLVMAHILFRHGNRVPNNPAYSKNPISNESYYPEGYGQLSEKGKKVSYRMGTTLHKRYSWFLGSTWNINYISARTTNVDRTKMSLQTMLAGFWPPVGNQVIDSLLNWQPIPFTYLQADKELDGEKLCRNFNTMKSEVENSAEIKLALSVYDPYFEYLSNMTGDNITSYRKVFDIAVDQAAQAAYGYPLEDWVVEALPMIEKIARDLYYIETNTTDLKKLAAGYLLKKIITDSQAKINGTISPTTRKMFLYSAHERNIAYFLRTLDVYDDKIPTFATQVIVELHLVQGVYGFQVYHQDWSTPEPKLLTVPGCDAFCPFDEFVSLYEYVIPDDDLCVQS